MTDAYKAGREAGIRDAAAKLQKSVDDWRSTGNDLPARKIEDEIPGILALLDNAPAGVTVKEPYIIKIGPDHGVCVGGRWNNWMFHKHADGHWVSQQKLTTETLGSALSEGRT